MTSSATPTTPPTTLLSLSMPTSLDQTRIPRLPRSAFYISDFISAEEERVVLGKIAAAPKPRWKQLVHRRLQTWPSDLINDAVVDAPLPSWLESPFVDRLISIPLSKTEPHMFASSPHGRPNHVLVNEYPPRVGIMPHKDGSVYYPVVCTVSLGASLCLNLHKSKDDGALDSVPVWRILQEPRSLLITTEELYTDHLHGIADIGEDIDLDEDSIANWGLLRSPADFGDGRNVRQTRTSLTYRDVIKVSKLGTKLSMLLKH